MNHTTRWESHDIETVKVMTLFYHATTPAAAALAILVDFPTLALLLYDTPKAMSRYCTKAGASPLVP